ncbi:MAG: hypothetical protein U1F76_01965 [Candidatus Competibacteraceae bacterium]
MSKFTDVCRNIARQFLIVATTMYSIGRSWMTNIDLSQIATSLVCLIFLLVVLVPTAIMLSLMQHLDYWKVNSPDLSARMLLYVITGSGDDFTRLTSFIAPFFALLAGLKSRSGEQSLFFFLFICLSVLGAVGSLIAKYFVMSPDGQDLFSQTAWVGSLNEFATWLPTAKEFFNASFHTFLTFVSILLGLRAAEK